MSLVSKKRLLRLKGRKGGDGEYFAYLPRDVLLSDAVRTLPHPAHRVLVALAAQYYGKNNGSVSLTRADAAMFGISNPYMLAQSLAELQERRLIVLTRPGSRRPPRSAFYALTWRGIDEPHHLDPHDATPAAASNGWKDWADHLPTIRKKKAGYQHWATSKKRKSAVYPRDTHPASTRYTRKPKNQHPVDTRLARLPVAHGYRSYIWGEGELPEEVRSYLVKRDVRGFIDWRGSASEARAPS